MDKDGRFTCMTHAGESVVNYLLTSHGNLTDIKDFNVHSLISNHAPVTFLLIINNYVEQNEGQKFYSYKWNEDYENDFIDSLRKDLHLLDQIVISDNSVNETVELFSPFFSSRAQPFDEKCRPTKQSVSFQSNKAHDKWLDEVYSEKRNINLQALRDFNCVKNDENRRVL